MITVLSILAFALLFVGLGLVRRENIGSSGCHTSPEDVEPSGCDSCPVGRDGLEDADARTTAASAAAGRPKLRVITGGLERPMRDPNRP